MLHESRAAAILVPLDAGQRLWLSRLQCAMDGGYMLIGYGW